jgi:hypothetical protein
LLATCVFADEAGHMDAYHTHAGLYWPEVKGFFEEYVGRRLS